MPFLTFIVSAVTEKHTYTYASGKLLREVITTTKTDGTKTTVTLDFCYDQNGAPFAMKYNGEVYYYITNLQGDVVQMINTSGSTVASYSYDPYGKTGSSTGTIARLNPLRYRGYCYDGDTGFYYTSSRYYDPAICRFINADESFYLGINGDFTSYNLFVYCGNNPVIREDDDGEFWHFVAGAAIGALASGITQVVSNVVQGNEWYDGLGVSVLTGAASGLLAASGFGVVAQTVGSAAISGLNNALMQASDIAAGTQDSWDWGSFALDVVVGGFAGAIGGNGASYGNAKSITSTGVRQTKRIMNNPGEIFKAVTYYIKTAHNGNKKFVITELAKSIGKGFCVSLGKTFIQAAVA